MTTTRPLAEHIERVTRRSRAFYAARTPGHFLVLAHLPYSAPPIPPLCDLDLDRQLESYLDARLAATRPWWAAKEGLDDDWLPSTNPFFGIAEHSAWLGLEVFLQETTCVSIPLVHAPDDIARLTLSPDNRWFRYMRRSYDYLRERQDGTFVLAVRGTMMPMDLANAVRGDEFYTDLLDEKEFAHQLLDFLAGAMPWYFDQVQSWASEVEGGHVYAGGIWMPQPCLGHVSNDASLLCSPAVYAEFGWPNEERLAQRYGRVYYHVHNEKLHPLPQLTRLPGLAILEVTNDPKSPPALENLGEILRHTGQANLMLHGTPAQIRAHLGELHDRNVIFDTWCRDRAEAEDLVAFVRAHSQPLAG
jgi:hypothetical protein